MVRASFKVKPRGRFSDSPALARKTGGVIGRAVRRRGHYQTDLIAQPRLQERPVQHSPAAQHQRFDMKLLFQLGKRQLIIAVVPPRQRI